MVILPGCELPGFIASNVFPRQKVKAMYVPVDRPTVVMIDDPRSLLPSEQYGNLIAERISQDFQKHKAVTQMIRPLELAELRHGGEGFEGWPIDRVGRELGAAQVLYVVIDTFDYAGHGHEVYRPTASARVKWVDATTGSRLFPEHSELGVKAELFFKHGQFDRPTHAEQTMLIRKLADQLGVEIGRRFYDHEQREVGSGYDD